MGVCNGLNLRSTFHCTQAVLPGMMERRSGKIVNIASTSWAGDALHAHYAAAKAAVVAFTRSAATQLGPYNINVNAVAPGLTERSIAIEEPSVDVASRTYAAPPLGRFNRADDIANAVLFLTSDKSRNISGSCSPWQAAIIRTSDSSRLVRSASRRRHAVRQYPWSPGTRNVGSRPSKAGGRFSTKLATPSAKSGFPANSSMSAKVWTIDSLNVRDRSEYTWRRMAAIDRGEQLSARSRAYCWASPRTASGSHTR
jgi:hypothetical protein